jgi:hypothetical protein
MLVSLGCTSKTINMRQYSSQYRRDDIADRQTQGLFKRKKMKEWFPLEEMIAESRNKEVM